jgi:uncharacterized protein
MSVIDCEAHPIVAGREELFAYMDRAWVERLTQSNFVLPSGIPHPGADRGVHGGGDAPVAEAFVAGWAEGVDAAILLPSQVYPSAGWCDDAMCAVYASAVNRYVAERWLPADERLKLAIAVSAHDPAVAVAEIQRWAGDDRVVAVSFSLIAVNLGQQHYRPILRAAAEHGLAVMIHPGGTEGLAIGPPTLGGVGPRLPEERFSLLPQLAQSNVASLIYDGVFVDLPELKVVFAGFGFEWARSLLWRLDQEWRNLRVDVPWVTDWPMAYAGRNIRLVVDDLGAAPEAALQQIARDLPETLLVYGSDRPFSDGDPEDVLRGIPEELRERVSALNAAETFPRGAFATAGSAA